MATKKRKKPRYIFVYRLEDCDGEGPYRNSGAESYFSRATNECGWVSFRHPSPWNDRKLNLPNGFSFDDYHFGFRNLDQYFRWMYKASWRVEFDKIGMRLNKYRVVASKVKIGDSQVIFKRKTAKLVTSYSPNYVNAKVSTLEIPVKKTLPVADGNTADKQVVVKQLKSRPTVGDYVARIPLQLYDTLQKVTPFTGKFFGSSS